MEKFDRKKCQMDYRQAKKVFEDERNRYQRLIDACDSAHAAVDRYGEAIDLVAKHEANVSARELAAENLKGREAEDQRRLAELRQQLVEIQAHNAEAKEAGARLDAENAKKALRGKALDQANATKAAEFGAKIAQEVLGGKEV